MNHLCHAKGCKMPVPRTMLMCLTHWTKVPKHIQVEVYDTYKPIVKGERPSLAYLKAARAAIDAIQEAK